MLAGGRSSRFGSDKALHVHEGRPLIGHVADALAGQCAELAVAGRDWGGLFALADRPGPGLGPMGGLCAALHHAAGLGHSDVLVAPCDLLGIPADAAARLAPGPAVADGQWLLGLWPSAAAANLERLLIAEGAIPARRWIEVSAAVARTMPLFRNVNRPEDL
ncbi:MAG: molybdenum cofactor guanylyltransferase [Sandaracinobacteroides sp.]